MAETSGGTPTGWRISKACQECRKRKIRCNGLNPCKTCHLRNTACVYRDFVRQRRKKYEYERSQQNGSTSRKTSIGNGDGDGDSLDLTQPPGRTSSSMQDLPNSVSATHMASPSCQMQLYYGPTSHFSLIQHVYRDLFANPTNQPGAPSREVEQAGEGLDLFSHRRIFFGAPDTHDGGKGPSSGDTSSMFLPYELAKLFLSRYLSTLYCLTPYRPRAYFEHCLDQLYSFSPVLHPDTLSQSSLLLVLAIGSLGTEYYTWGEILFERAKTLLTAFDDVYAHFQNEQGRPNSTFLHLGSAARKAFSAGLHKDAPSDDIQSKESIEERRTTFWCLYFYETWFCFHLGRPTSMSLKDITTEYTQDSFIRALVYLSKTMTRSADEIYGQRHQSLLHMWKVAVSIVEDLRNQESRIQQTLGLKLDASIQSGSLGVCQTMFTTMYYHTLLLTFRPFLIFRGHWQRERKLTHRPSTDIGSSNSRPTEAPSWLNEACNYTLTAAQKTLQHLSKASAVNDLVKQLRYHGYFVGSASFTLIYDIIHNENAAVLHLPSVYAALQTLSTMRVGDPIASTITSIQTVLRKINPSYEWSPPFNPSSSMPSTGPSLMQNSPVYEQAHHHDRNHQPPVPTNHTPQSLGTTIPNFHMSLPTMEMPMASGEDLFDFTQADMGWDFDFSTMDLETFLSVD